MPRTPYHAAIAHAIETAEALSVAVHDLAQSARSDESVPLDTIGTHIAELRAIDLQARRWRMLLDRRESFK